MRNRKVRFHVCRLDYFNFSNELFLHRTFKKVVQNCGNNSREIGNGNFNPSYSLLVVFIQLERMNGVKNLATSKYWRRHSISEITNKKTTIIIFMQKLSLGTFAMVYIFYFIIFDFNSFIKIYQFYHHFSLGCKYFYFDISYKK